MSRLRNAALIALAALAGIALAAVVTIGASRLARQHIGLSSEPLTAGAGLLPHRPTQRSSSPSRTGAEQPAGHAPAKTARRARAGTPPVGAAPAPADAAAGGSPAGEARRRAPSSAAGGEERDSRSRRDD